MKFCEDCGDEIPARRVALVPYTVFCVECASHSNETRRKTSDSVPKTSLVEHTNDTFWGNESIAK